MRIGYSTPHFKRTAARLLTATCFSKLAEPYGILPRLPVTRISSFIGKRNWIPSPPDRPALQNSTRRRLLSSIARLVRRSVRQRHLARPHQVGEQLADLPARQVLQHAVGHHRQGRSG